MNGPSWMRTSVIIGMLLSLPACQSFNTSSFQLPWFTAKEPEPQVVTPVTPPAPKPETAEELKVRLLVFNGEYTLSQNQLLTPASDNAYMYFSQALAIDPNNERAKGGMQGIVMRYVDLARQAASRGNYGAAKAHLDSASKVDPRNLLIAEVSKGLREQMAASPTVAPYRGAKNEFLLNQAQIGTDSPDIAAQLLTITQQLKAQDALAIIVARNDAEGRWIYHQMRAAIPGYLVRGDIQLGSPARITLVPRLQ
jgi:tetratricopeptide (TPR) repeat protein